MTTSTNLPTDTYYRGYRLHHYRGMIYIYFGIDLIDQGSYTREQAKTTIDEWLNAK